MDPDKIVTDVTERVRELIMEAQERAEEIVREAEADAARVREAAESQARERLAEVRTALQDLQGKLGDSSPQAEVTPGPVTVPEPSPPAVPEPTPDPVPDPVPSPAPVPEPTPEPVPEPTPPPDEGDPPAAAGAEPDTGNGERSADKAAARLVAMKMALDGAAREDIDTHLAAHYDVEHRDKLLDDVLARAKA